MVSRSLVPNLLEGDGAREPGARDAELAGSLFPTPNEYVIFVTSKVEESLYLVAGMKVAEG